MSFCCNKLATLLLAVTTTFSSVALADAYSNDELLNYCNQGNMDDCYILGTLYVDGDGIKKDLYAGSRLIEKACENGQVNACKTLGELYLTGKGLEVNYSKANYYVGKAC